MPCNKHWFSYLTIASWYHGNCIWEFNWHRKKTLKVTVQNSLFFVYSVREFGTKAVYIVEVKWEKLPVIRNDLTNVRTIIRYITCYLINIGSHIWLWQADIMERSRLYVCVCVCGYDAACSGFTLICSFKHHFHQHISLGFSSITL